MLNGCAAAKPSYFSNKQALTFDQQPSGNHEHLYSMHIQSYYNS